MNPNKKFKCPFCNDHNIKEKLISHIEKKHREMIPEGFTAARVLFHSIHKRPYNIKGTCIICKGETEWNEKTYKYNRLCNRRECKDKLRESYKKNMLKVYGTYNILNDMDQQEKMLRNRSISGIYTFKNGKIKQFVGSYEKKFLEFCDLMLNMDPDDIMMPGPTIEYDYKGKKHVWITDAMIIPYNLVIDVKDGGDFKNNREMISYREKQIEKEKVITNKGEYNYLRLTNNEFDQLIGIIYELKMQMIEDPETTKTISRVHELGNILFDDNNYYYNFDKWKNGGCQFVFLFGYSGSGKSTLGRELAKKYKVKYLEVDLFKDKLDSMYNLNGITDKNEKNTERVKCLKKYLGNQRTIIDGSYLMRAGFDVFKDDAIIIVGTSALHSTFRAIKRAWANTEREKNWLKNPNSKIELYLHLLNVPFNRGNRNLNGEVFKGPIAKDVIKNVKKYGSTHESSDYDLAKRVYDNLSDDEKKLVSPRGKFVDSPYKIYRYIEKVNNKPIGFIDAYKYNGTSDTVAFVILAVSSQYRGKGIAKKMLTNCCIKLKEMGYKKVIYRLDKENKGSFNLINNYEGSKKTNETKTQLSFEIPLTESAEKQCYHKSRKVESNGTYKDALNVFKKLTKEDKKFFSFGTSGESINTIYRYFHYIDNEPVGFVELSMTCKGEKVLEPLKDGVWIGIVVDPEHRGQGISKLLLNKAIQWFNGQSEFNVLCYSVDRDNKASVGLIKSRPDFKIYEPTKNYTRDTYYKTKKGVEIITESSTNIKLYHISEKDIDGNTLTPRIPSNYFTKNGFEDDTTPRVSFSTSIQGCLMGLSQNCKGKTYYVYSPETDIDNKNIYKPNTKEVPDSKITKEVWVLQPVKIKKVCKIYVKSDTGEDGIKFSYGNKTAELYKWDYEIIQESSQPLLISEKDVEYRLDDFKNHKVPVLWVTGLSGGGKTTTTKKLADEMSCECFSIDNVEQFVKLFIKNNIKKMDEWIHWNPNFKIIHDYLKKNPETGYQEDDDKWYKFESNIIELIVKAHSNSNPIIIEGIQIPTIFRYKKSIFNNSAIIIKGTSITTSIMRRIKRDQKRGAFINNFEDIGFYMKEYYNMYKGQNNFRDKAIKESNELIDYKSYSQQSDYTCGPSAAYTVMKWFLGESPDSESSIANIMNTNSMDGTSVENMSKYFKQKGWIVKNSLTDKSPNTYEEFISFIESYLKHNIPIMVENKDHNEGHWRVIVGLNNGIIKFADSYDKYDGNEDGFSSIPANKFFDNWYDDTMFSPKIKIKEWVIAYPSNIIKESNEEYTKNFVLPIDTTKFKSNKFLLCINTHNVNATFTLVDIVLNNPLSFKQYTGLASNWNEQKEARDFILIDSNNSYNFDESFEGTNVRTIGDGKVVLIKKNYAQYGNCICIDHGSCISTYCHLKDNSMKVNKGDTVKCGQVIGKIGNTGNSDIPHLHFELTERPFKSGIKATGFNMYEYIELEESDLWGVKDFKKVTDKCKAGRWIRSKSDELPQYCIIKSNTIKTITEAVKIPEFKPEEVQFIKDLKGSNNSYIDYKGKHYRVRVETLIVNDKGEIYVQKKDKLTAYGAMYKLPGGSAEPNIEFITQAENEIHEEAMLRVNNIYYTGYSYTSLYDSKEDPYQEKYLTPLGFRYEGAITYIYVAEYVGKYHGYVKVIDRTSMAKEGKFYKYKDIKWLPEHKKALEDYFKSHKVLKESSDTMDDVIRTGKDKEYDEYLKIHKGRLVAAYNDRVYALKNALLLSDEEVNELRDRIQVHDASRYSEEEWDDWRKSYFPNDDKEREEAKESEKKARAHHYKVNAHHPEHWNGKEMDKVSIAEMIIDWEADSKADGGNPLKWYTETRDGRKTSVKLNPKTREIVERVLNIVYDINMNLKDTRDGYNDPHKEKKED